MNPPIRPRRFLDVEQVQLREFKRRRTDSLTAWIFGKRPAYRPIIEEAPQKNSCCTTRPSWIPKRFGKVIYPNNRYRSAWDTFFFGLVIYSAVVLPYRIAFDIPYNTWWIVLDVTEALLYFIDIYLHFHTAIKSGGYYHTDKAMIRRKYTRSLKFYVHVCSSFPFEIAAGWVGVQWLTTLRAPRLLRCLLIPITVKKWTADIHKNVYVVRFATTNMLIVLMAHWLACLLYKVAIWEGRHNSWLELKGLADETSNLTLYLYSLYWTMVTLPTIGYGDVLPRTNAEYMVNTAMVVLGAALFSYNTGNISSWVAGQERLASKFRFEMERLRAYMKEKKFPKELQNRVNDYFYYVFESRLGSHETELLDDLSPTMRREFNMLLFDGIVARIPLFDGCDRSVIDDMLELLKPEVYIPNDCIVTAGQHRPDLWLFLKGKIEVIDESMTTVQILHDQSFYGDVQLLFPTETKCRYTLKTLTFVEAFSLKAADWAKLLREWPEYAARLHARWPAPETYPARL